MRIFRFVKSTLVKQVAIGLVVVAIPLSTVLAFQDTPPANDTSPSADLDNDMVEDEFDDDEFADLDLEDLMEIQVVEISSVAGVEQSLLETPSAVYVLDAEDVRRTGVQSIAEAIRLVPGMDVIQLNASTWAISSRGFNGTYANKLLVMVDGRTVYTPSFAGVFWDTQDVVLEDLDRIEVIRGPGATLWGANAVNGVINIVTKGAKDTQGLYLTAGTGTEERGFGTVRYGGQVDDTTFFRVYGKYANRDGTADIDGDSRPDDWDMAQGGFRMDGGDDSGGSWTLQGDVYDSGRLGRGSTLPTPVPFVTETTRDDGSASGTNLLFRLGNEQGATGWSLQGYFDYFEKKLPRIASEERSTWDIDFRHHFELNEKHALVWGGGIRHTEDNMGNSFFLNFSPHKRRATTYSAFVQDNITLIDERLMLMLGSKFEHNDYTGFEMQPGARISWTPNEKQTVWGSITRAVRVPDRIEDDAVLTVAVVAGPTPIQWVGDRSTESEELIAYELGYRWIPKPNLSLDFAGFFNDYDNLITYDAASATNGNHAESYGFEAAVDWTIEDNWRVRGSYSWFTEDMHGVMPDTDDIDNPRNQFNVRSFLDITNDLEFNSALYYVDNVPGFEASAYFKLDMGLTWRPSDNVEFAVWGQNLLDDHRTQGFDATGGYDEASYIERGVYAQLTFRF